MENKTRAADLPISDTFSKGVFLIDIDTTIGDYMRNVLVPDLTENDIIVKVPIIYGDAERWHEARSNGYLRDSRGKIQLPIIMFKRNSIARDTSMQHFREETKSIEYKKYSNKNRYDRFSVMNNAKPVYEQYMVATPAYVTVNYDVIIWTGFIEDMNPIVEAFQFASDRYWGDPKTFKFRTRIDNFDNQQEVSEGDERAIKTTFSLAVNAYILPDTFDKVPIVKKSMSLKRIVIGVETDLTGESTPTATYNEYADLLNFIAIRSAQRATFVNSTTVKLINVSVPVIPIGLVGSFDTVNWFSLYINGELKPADNYTYEYNGTTNEVIFTFVNVGFPIELTDEIDITGKFLEL